MMMMRAVDARWLRDVAQCSDAAHSARLLALRVSKDYVAATDGHRMHMVMQSNGGPNGVISLKSLPTLRGGSIEVPRAFEDTGDYPDLDNAIRDTAKQLTWGVTVSKSDVLAALDRADLTHRVVAAALALESAKAGGNVEKYAAPSVVLIRQNGFQILPTGQSLSPAVAALADPWQLAPAGDNVVLNAYYLRAAVSGMRSSVTIQGSSITIRGGDALDAVQIEDTARTAIILPVRM